MATRENRAPDLKTGSEYASRHIVVRPETRNRITRLMEGKRFTDQIIFKSIVAYCSVASGGSGAARYMRKSSGIGSELTYHYPFGEKPGILSVKIENNPVTGEDELFFNVLGFESVMNCPGRMTKYIHTKNERIKERYIGVYLPTADGSDPVWYNANGMFLIFQQMRMNIPIAERKALCEEMYNLICFCDSFIIGTEEQYDVIDAVKVFDVDW